MSWGLERISSRELSEWEAFERVAGPVGPMRDDLLNSRLLCMMANLVRGQGELPYPLEDFMPQWDATQPHPNPPLGEGTDTGEDDDGGPRHQAVAMFEAMFEAYATSEQ